MKRPRGLLRTLLLSVVVVTELVPAFSHGPATIAVVLSRDIAPYREALRGFEAGLQGNQRQIRLVEYNIETSSHDPAGLIEKIQSRKPTLILTLGSAATALVSDAIRDVPIVFSLVLPSSGRSSLEDLRASRGNITGASMEVPVGTQFETIRQVLPGAKRIGVLFDPAVSGSLIETARRVASEKGFELVSFAVSSENDVVRKMGEVDGNVDVLWSVADSTVFSPQGLKHILLSTLRSRIPFVGLSPSFVKAGALLALSCDYEDVGRQSGELAERILAGEEPARIPTAVPRAVSLSLNMNTARQIQVTLSEGVERKAEIVF